MLQAKRLFDKEKNIPHLPIKVPKPHEDGTPAGSEDGEEPPEGLVSFDYGSVSKDIERIGGRWIVVGGSMPERLGEPAVFHDTLKFARFDADCGYVLAADDSVQLLEFWLDASFNSEAKKRKTTWGA